MRLSTEFPSSYVRVAGKINEGSRVFIECDVYPVDEIDRLILHTENLLNELLDVRAKLHPHAAEIRHLRRKEADSG